MTERYTPEKKPTRIFNIECETHGVYIFSYNLLRTPRQNLAAAYNEMMEHARWGQNQCVFVEVGLDGSRNPITSKKL